MPIHQDVTLRVAVVILAVIGLLDAFYFTFAYYGRVRKSRWVPEILCAREGSNCVTVVQTPYGRVFGVPNSLLGIFYYVLLILWAVLPLGMASGFGTARTYVGWMLIAASVVTVILGFYLIYALLKKLHTHCPFCYAAHAINLTLLILLILLI